MRNRVAISGAMISLMISMSAVHASDVWIQQAHGNMPAGTPAELTKPANTTPEGAHGAPTAAASSSPTQPATCNQQNASSPSCYSATQQSKGGK